MPIEENHLVSCGVFSASCNEINYFVSLFKRRKKIYWRMPLYFHSLWFFLNGINFTNSILPSQASSLFSFIFSSRFVYFEFFWGKFLFTMVFIFFIIFLLIYLKLYFKNKFSYIFKIWFDIFFSHKMSIWPKIHILNIFFSKFGALWESI